MQIKLNEIGRSMVEILGVMAVIGVLSVGGIAGYKYAMDKYRANDIVYEVNMRATDIWHKFQDKALPEHDEAQNTDFPEWSLYTATGYPIYIHSFPDVAFKTYVEGVSSTVCKNVVNMNLNDIIKGIQFVQVANGEGEPIKYTGDASICGETGTDNLVIFTAFTDTEDTANPDHCVEKGDCDGLCSPHTCDKNMTCRNKCFGLDDTPHCFDDGAGGKCVACITNADCSSYGDNYVCNTANHTCQEVRKCDANEYRAASGACIPCSDVNAVEISQEKFEDLALNIQDATTGVEQCTACNNTHKVTIDEATNKAYCGIGCIQGVNYESLNEGCIPCRKADGSPNDEPHQIHMTNEARKMCEVCGLIWWQNYYQQNKCAYMPATCPEGTFAVFGETATPHCEPCTNPNSVTVHKWGDSLGHRGSSLWTKAKIQASCNSCPERTPDGSWSKRELITSSNGQEGYCRPVCEQPDEGASITACTDNDDSTVCNRQFRSGGTCYACSETSNKSIETGETDAVDTYEEQLCINCGRTIRNGYCSVVKELKLGQFRTKAGTPVDCTASNYNFAYEIVDEADSKCVANCKMKDGKYSTDADALPTRQVRTSNDKNYCDKICPANQWQNTKGNCYDCSQEWGSTEYLYNDGISTALCDDACKNAGQYKRKMAGSNCVFEVCPDASDGTKRFKSYEGECNRCDSPGRATLGPNDGASKTECDRCSNRISNGASWNQCALIDPGVSGVCNSDNWTLPENLASDYSDLYDEVQEYVNGEHDGETFRDNNGLCYPCTTDVAVKTSLVQCNLCNIDKVQRTYTSGVCSLGGCQTNQFMNATPACVNCTPSSVPNSYISATYLLKEGSTSSCAQCGNRQVMTIGSTGQKYCVSNECIQSADWQSASNGKCQNCTADNNVREIGTEMVYRQQCEACNRVAFSKQTGDKTSWYCSKIISTGYFIDASGNLQNCTSAPDTQIPNTTKASSTCEASGCNRVVETDADGNLWCVNS